MSEPNEQTNETTPPNEICTLRIMFPVVSDAQALEVKGKIATVLKDIAGSQIHFAIMPNPTKAPFPMR